MGYDSLIKTLWLLPLVTTLLGIGVVALQLERCWAHRVAIMGHVLSLTVALGLGWRFMQQTLTHTAATIYTWLSSPALTIAVGYYVDRTACLMLAMVTFVALAVVLFSVRYMQDDPGYRHFFVYVSGFVFMMLTLVLADDLVVLFMGWEGMGVMSYALIGYYLSKTSAADAAYKAFVVNRIGDMGMLLGIAGCVYAQGSTHIQTLLLGLPGLLQESVVLLGYDVGVVPLVAACFLLGVMAKSAQIPLHIWLPGSMEGPTPISALIHAATMVASGVYLVLRMAVLFDAAPWVQNIMALLGASGALWLGLVAVFQDDIKKVAAYSTLSQLGYMVAALGVRAYSLALLHLIVHAMFKALLFLATGAYKTAFNTQDITKLRGLGWHAPWLGLAYTTAALSLSGVPPFSGFFSKEAIVHSLVHPSTELWGGGYVAFCAVFGVAVTSFYSFQVVWSLFARTPVSDVLSKQQSLGGEMSAALIMLSIPSVVLGGVMFAFTEQGGLLGPVRANWSIFVGKEATLAAANAMRLALTEPSLYCALLGMLLAFFYVHNPVWTARVQKSFLGQWLKSGYALDRAYERFIWQPWRTAASLVAYYVEQHTIDAGVEKGVALGTWQVASSVSGVYVGLVKRSIQIMLMAALGMFVVGLWLIFKS